MSTPSYRFPIAQGPEWKEANALGQLPSGSTFTQSGRVTGIGASGSTFDIRPQADTLVLLDSAERMVVTSVDVRDVVGGVGASSILIEGLDNNFNSIEELLPLTTVSETTVNTFRRINNVQVVSSDYVNACYGDILLTAEVAGTVQSSVVAELGESEQTNYTTPRGATTLLYNVIFSVGKGDEVEVAGLTKLANIPDNPWVHGPAVYAYEALGAVPSICVPLPEMTDFKFTAHTITNNPRILITSFLCQQV